jgi:hypothetical protein
VARPRPIDLPPGEGMHLLSRCSGDPVETGVALVSRTGPFSRDRARRPGLPSPVAVTCVGHAAGRGVQDRGSDSSQGAA